MWGMKGGEAHSRIDEPKCTWLEFVTCTRVYPLKPCCSQFMRSRVHVPLAHLLSLTTVPLPIAHKPRRATSTPPPPPRSAPAFTLTRRHDTAFFPPLRKPGRIKDSISSHLWDCHPAGKGEGCEAACDSRWWCERRATGRGWVRG